MCRLALYLWGILTSLSIGLSGLTIFGVPEKENKIQMEIYPNKPLRYKGMLVTLVNAYA